MFTQKGSPEWLVYPRITDILECALRAVDKWKTLLEGVPPPSSGPPEDREASRAWYRVQSKRTGYIIHIQGLYRMIGILTMMQRNGELRVPMSMYDLEQAGMIDMPEYELMEYEGY